MITLETLLAKGYFPRELPPPFTTETYAAVLKDGTKISQDLLDKCPQSRPAIYNLARAGTLRRKLSILNPISYYRLAKFIEQKWSDLEPLAKRSPLSLTHPVLNHPQRAIERQTPLSDYPQRRAAARCAARYILQTDIARFYHSIYTHSIPWAIHGKAATKADRSPKLWGNVLDKLIRDAQDGQTMGIPIGPDISLAIAETILGAVDQELSKRVKVRGLRYIDDYELSVDTLAEAETVQGALQEVLNDFELALNGAKTEILKLPLHIQEPWVSELGNFRVRLRQSTQHTDVIRYFDRAFALANKYPIEGVLKYAVGRAANIAVHPENRTIFQHLLLQCAMVEPGCLPKVLKALCQFKAENDKKKEEAKLLAQFVTNLLGDKTPPEIIPDVIDESKLASTFNGIIQSHATQGHSSEVCWAIWGCLLFGIKITDDSAKPLAVMDDPATAILCLHAQQNGLLPSKDYFAGFQRFLTAQDLYGEQWLVSYEANVKGWLKSPGGGDNVADDARFSILKNNGVSFYNVNAIKNTFDEAANSIVEEDYDDDEVSAEGYYG
jgi:hypothetical protein